MATAVDTLEFSDDDFDDYRLNSIKLHIGEVDGRRIQILNELKSMLSGCSGLRPFLDDDFLLRFLRSSRFRPDTAVKRLRTYYYNRRHHPGIFGNYLPSNTSPAQALNHIKALPCRAKNLSPVVVIKLGQTDFQRVTFLELLRLEVMVFETLMQNPVTQLTGITVIIDCDGISQAGMSQITTSLPACYDVFHHDCTLGIKYLHVVNVPVLLQLLYQNILPTFSEDKHSKAVFYPPNSDLEELHSQVSLDYLPEEYGGNLQSANLVDLNPIINSKEDYFREQMQYGVPNDEIELD